MIGRVLAKLDERGIADSTLVVYTTDGGTSPFRSEKATTWEAGIRVPMMVHGPARIDGGRVSNELIYLEHWVPTMLSAVGNAEIVETLKGGHAMDGITD